MSDRTSNTSCFDRWLAKNPGGTYAQFQKALSDFNKGKSFSPAKVVMLPGGAVVSTEGLSPSEIRSMNAEHNKTAAGNQ